MCFIDWFPDLSLVQPLAYRSVDHLIHHLEYCCLGFLFGLVFPLVHHLAHQLNLGSPLGSLLVLHLGSCSLLLAYRFILCLDHQLVHAYLGLLLGLVPSLVITWFAHIILVHNWVHHLVLHLLLHLLLHLDHRLSFHYISSTFYLLLLPSLLLPSPSSDLSHL